MNTMKLWIAIVGMFCSFSACTKSKAPETAAAPRAEGGSAPLVGSTSAVVTEEDCKLGLTPMPKSQAINCGQHFEDPKGVLVATSALEDPNTILVSIGNNRYVATRQGDGWSGQGFKIGVRLGKVVQQCFDTQGNKISPECENTITEADYAFECGKEKRTYSKWRLNDGC